MVQPEAPASRMSSEAGAEPRGPPLKRFPGVDTLIRNDHDFGSPSSDAQLLGLGPGAVNSYLSNGVGPAAKRVRLSGSNGSGRVLFLNSSFNGRAITNGLNGALTNGHNTAAPPYAATQHSYLASPTATVRRTYAAQQASASGAWPPGLAVDGDGLTSITSTSTFTYTTASQSGGAVPSRKIGRLPQGQYYQYRPPASKRQQGPAKAVAARTSGPAALRPAARRVAPPSPVPSSPFPAPAPEKDRLPPPSRSPMEKPESSPVPPSPTPAVDNTQTQQTRLESRALLLNSQISSLIGTHSSYSAAAQLSRLSSEAAAYLNAPALINPAPVEPNAGPKRRNAARDAALEAKLRLLVEAGEIRKLGLSKDDLTSKSAAELGRWLKRYDLKRIHELLPAATAHAFTAGKGQLGLTPEEALSVEASASSLSAHLGDLDAGADSEATEESSGGESEDEWDAGPARGHHEADTRRKKALRAAQAQARKGLSIRSRAKFRAGVERARLGSRWAWVERALGELENRVRQSLDIGRQLKAKKTPVTLEGSPEEGCARTRPLAAALPRRRLLHLSAMGGWQGRHSDGAPGPPCTCAPPLPPCIRCASRLKASSADLDPNDPLPVRRAAIDSGFHPALSRREAGSLPLLLQAHLKEEDSELRPRRRKRPAPPPLAKKEPVSAVPQPKNGLTSFVHNSAQLSQSLPSISKQKASSVKPSPHSPLKLKIKLNGLTASTSSTPSPAAASPASAGKPKSKPHRRRKTESERSETGSREVSPALSYDDWASSGPSSPMVAVGGGRRSTAYDIDNIVIDPSVAATTRVQKLEYKEIAIPGWRTFDLEKKRVLEVKAEPATTSSLYTAVVGESEDVSDEAYLGRHLAKEEAEKRRFAAYKQAVWSGAHSLDTTDSGMVVMNTAAVSSRPSSPFPPHTFLPPPRPPH